MVDYLNYGKKHQQPLPSKDEVVHLFPTPLLICSYPNNYDKELEFIRNMDCKKKNGNPHEQIHYNRQSENTFVLDIPELATIRSFIEAKVQQFTTQIMASDDKLVITQSWLNKSGKGESHHEHTHPNSIVSGVWYPFIDEKLPPIKFAKNEGREVLLNKEKFNTYNCESFMMPTKKGELLLFPSNLKHSVPTNQSDEERISLSFNTWPKGSLGNTTHLTYLPLDRCI